MAAESRKALAVLSLFLLAAVVGIIIAVVLIAEKNKDVEDLKDKLSKYEAVEGKEDEQSTLPDVDWDNCDDIAIIGAGIAGSYAGYRLRDLDKKITVYEYSDRIGGRCYTGKFTAVPDVNVEFGAMRFYPGKHKLLNKVIKDLGLSVVHFDPQSGPFSDSNVYLRGQHVRYGDIPNTDMPYYLPDKFKGKTLGEINWELFRDNTNVNPNVKGYLNDRLNLKSADGAELWKQSRQDFYMKYLHVDTAKYLQDVGAWDGTYQNSTAALVIPTSPPPSMSEPVKTVATGFQSIPETMMGKFINASVRHSLMRNHQLISVSKNKTNGKYVLTFQPTETTDGITKTVREGHYLAWRPRHTCASKVIIAVGRLALEQIDWEGLKQPEIHDYITNSLSDIPAAKLYLAFDKAWWRNFSFEDPGSPHYSLSDTPLRNTFEYDMSESTKMAVLNAAYMDSDLNVRFWRMVNKLGTRYPGNSDANVSTTSEVVRYAMKFLSEIYNVSLSDLNDPAFAALGLWDRYPYGAGWYKWRPGYNWKEVETKMLRPSASDDVFVTCNAFSSTNRSTVTEGALEIVELVLRYFMSENS